MLIDERIKQGRQRMGLSKSALARILGVTPTSCISWELPDSDRNSARPNVDNLTRLAVVFNVRFDWLANGRGPMTYAANDDANSSEPVVLKGQLPPDQEELLELFSSLPAAKQNAVMTLVKGLQSDSSTDS